MTNIEIITIAEKKLKRRSISRERVRETVNFPSQVVEGYGGCKVAQKKYMIGSKEYLLRVVDEEKEMLNVVITAYVTSQIERYWK